jgi:Cu(I)/Ag(I) efflux system membrane fusion protein
MSRINETQREPESQPASVRPQTRWRLTKVGVFVGCGLLILAVGGTLGYLVARRGITNALETTSTTDKAIWWTCSMHPQIKLPGPGKCPICFMDLIPLSGNAEDEGSPRQLTLSRHAVALAEIETTPVRRQYATAEIRMVGKVGYDETKVANITAWVPGRLDRLFVDYTGITVRKGDHLVSLYSPDLIVAQKELLQTWKAHNRPNNPAPELTASTLKSTEEKLRLLGVLPEQIEAIKQRGSPSDHLTVYSPIGGIVIEKMANEGMYVQTGTKIYTIADLSVVWVNLEAYESDLPWLRYGQQVEFTTESHPGESFKGHIAFIDPIVDEKTRTVRVRVNAPNPNGKLKPGLFVRAVVRSRLAADGRVFDTSLVGKWISPMHPEIVKDGPGKCDVCGMDLVRADELGYVVPEEMPEKPLVIPASAPLITGKRAVVYVRLPNTEKPTFEGREVVLGPRATDHYIVRQGLHEGELVVTNGSFKIDSALQIQARPSMMSPEGGASESSRPKESGNAQ